MNYFHNKTCKGFYQMPNNKPGVGSISWCDLTIPNAEEVKNFYSKVVGWENEPLSMGEYNDFVMIPPESGNGVADICHARGGNAGLPAQWLIYITVKNIEESANEFKSLGGKIIVDIKNMSGYGRYSIIQDPAGAVCALFESKK